MPKVMAEKKEFRAMLNGMRTIAKAENFDEAVKEANECFKTDVIPGEVQMIFDIHGEKVESSNEPFWVYMNALGKFHQAEKRMPVSGTIPDMISMPQFYIKLQKIYIEQAQADLDKMRQIIAATCE